jgi:hypothetical protein
LIASPMLSIAAPVVTLSTHPTQACTIQLNISVSRNTTQVCCQLLENHCSSGQCDCGQLSHSLTNNPPISISSPLLSTFQLSLSTDFFSQQLSSLYRPPRRFL